MNFLVLPKLIAIFLAGLCLSLCYFSGLWITVHRLTVTHHPYLLIFTSFVFRLASIMFFLYELLKAIPLLPRWKFFAMFLLGFWLGRRIWLVACQSNNDG